MACSVARICLLSGLREFQRKSNPCACFAASSLRHNEMNAFKKREGTETFPREENPGNESEVWKAKSAHLIIPLYIFGSCSPSDGPQRRAHLVLSLHSDSGPTGESKRRRQASRRRAAFCNFLCSFPCAGWDPGDSSPPCRGSHTTQARCPASLRVFPETPGISLLGIVRELSSKTPALNHLE